MGRTIGQPPEHKHYYSVIIIKFPTDSIDDEQLRPALAELDITFVRNVETFFSMRSKSAVSIGVRERCVVPTKRPKISLQS